MRLVYGSSKIKFDLITESIAAENAREASVDDQLLVDAVIIGSNVFMVAHFWNI